MWQKENTAKLSLKQKERKQEMEITETANLTLRSVRLERNKNKM